MSIQTHIFPEHALSYTVFAGELSLADLVRGYTDRQALPGVHAVRHAINDLRGLLQMKVFLEGLTHFADMLGDDMARQNAPRDIAIVAPPQSHVGLMSEYARKLTSFGIGRCAVFQDFERAADWLGLKADVLSLRLPSGRRLIDPDPLWRI